MRLTIGMAHYDDYDGVYFTVQAMRLADPDLMAQCEFVVVDNSPGSPHGKAVEKFLGSVPNARYIATTDVVGTAAPRDRVFREARGDAVLCLDCHVLLAPGALRSLLGYYAANPDTRDLLSGPMLLDGLDYAHTHFADEWRGEMWGTWATAWIAPDGRPVQFRAGPNETVEILDLMGDQPRGRLPGPWPGHEHRALQAGYVRAENSDKPFEIPAMGLGLFSCRKEAWLGFNPAFRQFGGEEWYIHTKFRQAGARCLCLPSLRWVHRFARPGGVRYPLTLWHKARNYVLGHRELGLSLHPVQAHFVGENKLSQQAWAQILEGATEPEQSSANTSCSSCTGGRAQPPVSLSLDELYAWVQSVPRDLDQHAGKIREIASQASSIRAFVKRREWNALLAAGRPTSLVVYQAEKDPLLDQVHAAVKAEQSETPRHYTTHVGPEADSLKAPAETADLLVLDTVHHADRLWRELDRHGRRAQRILIRGTGAFGEHAEGGGAPGLLPAIRRWIKENPEWTTVYHTREQYGITLLSRVPSDKKPLPSLWQQGVNVAKASWRAGTNVLGKYGPLKDTETQNSRLALCLICDQHTDGRCAQCGCPVDAKTSFPTESCPLGKWSTTNAG